MTLQHLSRPLAIQSLSVDGTFTGYASVFDIIDSHKECVQKGAFKASLSQWHLKDGAPAMLWMHDPTIPIGIWTAMAEDKNGLIVYGKLALGTQKGREAYELLKMKALTGLSIGYRVIASKIDIKRKVRVLTNIDLFEVSLVTFPSNDKARVQSVKTPRSITLWKGNETARTIAARLNEAARKLKQRPLNGRNK